MRNRRQLHDAGVCGVRFIDQRLVDVTPTDVLQDIARRIAPLGWHVVVYFGNGPRRARDPSSASLPTRVVVDHKGRPDARQPVKAGVRAFRQFMHANDHVWSKVSGEERLSVSGPPDYSDFVPFARRIVEAFPDRVLWGTDWPHPNMKSHMPDDGDLVDLLPRIAPTAELQRRLLVDNPMRLYW
jgi:2-pyrone-4,6-dicarboxylate lactonase